jgi:hypothetical protein
MSERRPRLIAVEGLSARAVRDAARAASASKGNRGISWWDASGLFDQLTVDGDESGVPSARTLLLLYAADLAFRLRWEIQPALAEGKTVVAAPYVDTAFAVGRAAGLPAGWLRNLLRFAPEPDKRLFAGEAGSRKPGKSSKSRGFVEFACETLSGQVLGFTRKDLAGRAHAQLRARAGRRVRSEAAKPSSRR